MKSREENGIFARVLSFDWEAACLSFSTGVAGFVSATLQPGDISVKSVEAADCGQLFFTGLAPDTDYTGLFKCECGETEFHFRTLPAPKGEILGQFALISDPHISLKPENRKGRFFIESGAIVADVLRQCHELGCSNTLWPGDITNSGVPAEYDIAASILRTAPGKPLTVPGNHDHTDQPVSGAAYKKYFGETQWSAELPGIGTVVGLDTGNKTLNPAGAELLQNALDKGGRLIVITHYQLYPAPWIKHNGGTGVHVINNASGYRDLLDRLAADSGTVIYAGHQNITTITRLTQAVQLNLPQPVQFPCGFIRVRCYSDGFYHTFIPIASEVLNQWSRRASKAAAEFYNEPQWSGDYRCGGGSDQSNFFLPLK